MTTMQPATYAGEDMTGWLLSPKIDGVRARWTGDMFLTRGGKRIDIPHLAASLPCNIALDGELFAGSLSATVSAISPNGDRRNLAFHSFDAPLVPAPFSVRSRFCSMQFTVCRGEEHFADFVEDCLANGFEGTVAHDPTGLYRPGVSRSILKLKPFMDDEAVCTGISSTGRPSLLCDWRGVEIKVPNIPASVVANPPIGKRVTFSFQERTAKGLPRHPVFCNVRDYE